MKLTSIESGFFKLDGGAMFGVVPKTLWNRLNPADDNNMCTWSLRCMLIQTNDRNILVDTGMGNKQGEKFMSYFFPHGEDTLFGSIEKAGLKREDITDVFITHHHFDHNGGAVMYDENRNLVPSFPNAKYWSNRTHWDWAADPNPREKASFLKENFIPLAEQGVVDFIKEEQGVEWLPGINVEFASGHTEAMMILDIDIEGRHLIYCADLLPSSYHISMPYVMAYDVKPLDTLIEKKHLLERAADRKDILFFEHDPVFECGTVKRNEKGRIVLDETFTLAEALQMIK